MSKAVKQVLSMKHRRTVGIFAIQKAKSIITTVW